MSKNKTKIKKLSDEEYAKYVASLKECDAPKQNATLKASEKSKSKLIDEPFE